MAFSCQDDSETGNFDVRMKFLAFALAFPPRGFWRGLGGAGAREKEDGFRTIVRKPSWPGLQKDVVALFVVASAQSLVQLDDALYLAELVADLRHLSRQQGLLCRQHLQVVGR